MIIVNTRSKEIANYYMEMFNVQTPHYAITERKCKFLSNIMYCARVCRKGIGIVCVFV